MQSYNSKPFAVLAAISLSIHFSANADALDGVEALEVITISGTKTKREINEIAATVTQVTSEQIDSLASTNIRDILRYEPGISVEGNGRFGLAGFNIRGINGDRVLILLDGVPIADEFSFGPNLSARRDFVDIDLISTVDIVRGPASTLYGSDAIGGVVAFRSKSPNELIADDKDTAIRLKSGYDSQSNTFSSNITYAGTHNDWQWLLNAGIRDGDETQSHFSEQKDMNGQEMRGSNRNSANPQDNKAHSALAKVIYQPSASHAFTFTTDYQRQDSKTTLLSDVGTVSRGVLTLDSEGDDEQTRHRLLLNYVYQPQHSHLKRVDLSVFSQQSDTLQHTNMLRSSPSTQPPTVTFRQRDSKFKQDAIGTNLQFDHSFDLAGEHYLIYGASWQQTDSESIREGATLNTASNTLEREFSIFPARDFPISTLTEKAIFIQDEYQLLNGKIRLSPGLRYDMFTLSPNNDSIFSNANPGVDIVPVEEEELTGKFGAIYNPNETLSLWAQYAEGFRIPPMDDVNVGFTNFAGGYTSLANPDLLPESVTSWEFGLRTSFKAIDFSFNAYRNAYKNFIESLAVKGFNPTSNLLEFQAKNIDDVKINGVDLHATWIIGETFDVFNNWQARFSTSHQSSENTETGAELSSVLPAQSVLGIQYGEVDSVWHLEFIASHTAQAPIQENTSPDTVLFRAPSFTTFDLLGHYQLRPNIRINLGVFNLTNNKYWLASEVLGRDRSANLNRFTSPGRNFSTNLIVSF